MYTHKGGILGVVWKSVIGVEFARLPFDSAAKTSGFSEASVLYKMSLIVLPGNNSAGRIPRTQRVLQIELLIWDAQKNAFLWGDKLLILPYLFICFRCLFVSACVRLQRGLCLVFFFVCFVLVLFLCFVCGFCLVDFWFVCLVFFWKVQMVSQCWRWGSDARKGLLLLPWFLTAWQTCTELCTVTGFSV